MLALHAPLEAAQPIDFNRQVRPILSENCFKCHGFDEKAREARFALTSASLVSSDFMKD